MATATSNVHKSWWSSEQWFRRYARGQTGEIQDLSNCCRRQQESRTPPTSEVDSSAVRHRHHRWRRSLSLRLRHHDVIMTSPSADYCAGTCSASNCSGRSRVGRRTMLLRYFHFLPRDVSAVYIEWMTSQDLWSRYDRHFVGITWHNVWS